MEEIILSRQTGEYVPKSKWIASLSNGETIFEDNIPGQTAAWKRLGQYVRQNKLAITKLRVQLGGLEVEMPAHQEGYIQKKKIASTGSHVFKSICIGHVSDGRAVLHQLGEDRSSHTTYPSDPGPPWTIYRHDVECLRSCCTEHIEKGFEFTLDNDEYVVQRKANMYVFASKIKDGKPARGKPKKFHISEVLNAIAVTLG